MVITDIQSSARLTNCMPSEMSADHERHDRLLRHLMLLYNGIEVATEGDSFHVCNPRFTQLSADSEMHCPFLTVIFPVPLARHAHIGSRFMATL